jgi:hypothetical protein
MNHIISSQSLVPVIKAEKKNNGADFTIKSLQTGKEYTYRITRKDYNGNWFTFISVEQEYQKFVRLGYYANGNIIKARTVVETPSAKAIAYVLNKIEQNKINLLDNQVHIMHTGNCLRCGRPLTDSHSIEVGLGPICKNL